MEPLDQSKLQVVVRKVLASSSVYYLILVWLVRVVVFVLWIGKGILLWVLTVSFSLIRECTQKYLSVALVSFALTPQQQKIEGTKLQKEFVPEPEEAAAKEATDEEEAAEEVAAEEEDTKTSPLLPIVLRDRLQIWEDNLSLEDRERLSYEFDKIVAPQVSAFQLGEIIVPIDDTRQLATFLKRKLTDACKSADIDAVICGSILDIRAKGCISHAVESSPSIASGDLQHAVVYIAARVLQGKRDIHLVLVGRKVEHFLGSSEFRSRFNPPRTRGDKNEWHKWTLAYVQSLRESAIETAQELLTVEPVRAQMW